MALIRQPPESTPDSRWTYESFQALLQELEAQAERIRVLEESLANSP